MSIQTRILDSFFSYTDSDYIAVVAQPVFGVCYMFINLCVYFYKHVQTRYVNCINIQLNYVTFNGHECSGTGQHGTPCTLLMSDGISEVTYGGGGEYKVYFSDSFLNSNYIILSASNVYATGSAITNIGGNNDASDSNYGILQEMVRLETREIKDNDDSKSNYLSVVAGYAMNDTSHPGMKWVTFNGEDCSGAGIHGTICDIFESVGVLEVVRESIGRYKIYWNEAFGDNNYVLLCDSNVEGTGGTVCILVVIMMQQIVFMEFQQNLLRFKRVMNSNNNSDSDYIVVLAF